ncbi:MAG: diguanylate cyclase [Candidatus Omnitrophota bacterium]
MKIDRVHKILIITEDSGLRNILDFCFDGWGYEVFFDDSSGASISKISKVAPDVIIVDVNSATKDQMSVCGRLKDDFATTHVPIIALINKRHLRQKLLDFSRGVDDYLIKPPDPLELRVRIEMAIKRTRNSYYASPLTGLPGGIIAEEILKEKIESGIPFVIGHADIDNFKSFNDKYGYLKGDRVILQTAYMLSNSVRNLGNKDDFVGHIGGDDFILITTPDKYDAVCHNFICMFDTIIPFHYGPADRKQRHIKVKDRTNTLRNMPIMSMTVALVIKNSAEYAGNLIELNEKVTEVKQYLKKISGSKFMADRRIQKSKKPLNLQVFKNAETVVDNYKPLGQLLLEKKAVTLDQLDRALKLHWKRGVLLGEVLTDLGFLSEENLLQALEWQGNSLELGKQ